MFNESHFLKNTRAIQKVLDLGSKEYISRFGMTSRDAEKHLFNPKSFPLKFAMNFCEYYELDLEILFSENFDVKVFALNYLKQAPALPTQYQLENNSRAITLINFVNGFQDAGLDWVNELIFRRLQIPKSILFYPEQEIPFKLILNYMDLIEKFHSGLNVMKNCGQEGIINLNKKFQFVTPGMHNDVEFYDEFFSELITKFDKSCKYELISAKDDELIIKCGLKEEFKDLYHLKTVSSRSLLNYKCGIGAGLSTLFGQSASESYLLSAGEHDGHELICIKLPKQRSSSPDILH